MKLSFMTFACPDWRFDQIVEAADQIGYQGIEFRCDAGHNHGVEVTSSAMRRKELASRLDRARLKPVCLSTSLSFLADDVMDEAIPRLELAGDLGCRGVRVFTGKAPPGSNREDMFTRAAARLRQAAEFADEHGVEIWLETQDAAARAIDAADLLRRADHPALGLVWDNLHTHRAGEELEATKTALRDFVRHVHFHNGLNRRDAFVVTPMGSGQLPMDPMLLALVELDYEGYLSGEWFGAMYGPDPEQALQAYHDDVTRLMRHHHVPIETND